jgi:hypothetical protein
LSSKGRYSGKHSLKVVAVAAVLGLAIMAVVEAGPIPAPAKSVIGSDWKSQGPGPISPAQVENIVPGNEAVGAIHTVAAHPANAKVLYAGAVNGGVWKTNNADSQHVNWHRLTDFESSLSIGALELDPLDASHETLVAGIGTFSSFGRLGGQLTGLLRTQDGGGTWQAIDGGGTLVDKNVSGVASRGTTLAVSINVASPNTLGNLGVFRSTDDGATFTQVSNGNGAATGLPFGITHDLVGDPSNPGRLFTSVIFATLAGGLNGLYRSDDTGASWTKVSDAAIDALLLSGGTSNVELAVGRHDNVYAAIANSGRLAGLFRSGDGGATWTALDLPRTGPNDVGIHPGGQASIHMSIVADPNDPDICYVGGDRQPNRNEEGLGGGFPNSIGARNFSGRLFRVDASLPPGSQFAHLTNSDQVGPAGGGTASGSSPHADSREMVFTAAGDLVQVDDGGIYKRTSPQSAAGDWFSLNGDIEVTEHHDLSFDGLTGIHVAGNQDNGTPMQEKFNDRSWFLFVGGDGGDVAIDTTSTPGFSVRYTSAQFLGSFNRSFWDSQNNFFGFVFVGLNVLGGGSPVAGQFATPIELNAVDPTRLVIGGGNSVYESFDQGDNVTEIGPGIVVNGTGFDPISYGHPGDPDFLVVGRGDDVFVRNGPAPNPLALSATYPSGDSGLTVRDTVVDQDTGTAFLVNRDEVWQTPDGGVTWTELTGNIQSLDPFVLRAIAYVTDPGGDALVVSSFDAGVLVARESDGFAVWHQLGTGLPRAPVMDLDFDPVKKLVSAGTLGRGTWRLNAGSINP